MLPNPKAQYNEVPKDGSDAATVNEEKKSIGSIVHTTDQNRIGLQPD